MLQEQTNLYKIFSVLSYLRDFFPEDCFYEEMQDKLRLRILKRTEKTELFINWIKTLENINKIKRVLLGVIVDNQFEEIYNISLTENIDLKDFCRRLQKMPEIAKRKVLRLKVYTESNIQIDKFVNKNEVWEIDKKDVVEFGDTKVYYKRAASLDNENFQELDCVEGYKALDDTVDNHEVKCICTINNRDNPMIECFKCKKMLHTHCCGFFSNSDKRIPKEYICLFCTREITLVDRNLSVFRRMLSVIYNEDVLTTPGISKRIGVDQKLLKGFLDKLKTEGFIERVPNTIKFNKVTTKAAKDKLKDLFNGTKWECNISIDQINCYE